MADVETRAIEARRTEVARLVHCKKSLSQIAAALGIGKATAGRDVVAIRAEWRASREAEISQHVAEELDLLARLQEAVLPAAVDGKVNLWAVDRALAIAERRAKLLGLDAPTKQQVAGDPDAPLTVIVRYEGEEDGGPAHPDPAPPP